MVTVGEWCEGWFYANRHKWKSTAEGGYRNLIFHRIIPDVGDVRLDMLNPQTVAEFYAGLSTQGLGSRTVWCVHLLLRRCMDEACRAQLIEENPVGGFQMPQTDEHRRNPLRLGQIQRYLNAAEEQGILPMVYIGLTSGLRQCELLELRWDDIYGRYIHRGKRTLILNNKAQALLAQQSRTSPCIFTQGGTGEPYKLHQFYYRHKKLLEQARLPWVTFRDLQRQCMEVHL